MATTYRLHDEPEPSALANWVVNPSWPLLAVMVAGAWLSWPWFAFNAIAMGSPTRKKEIALAVGGFVGTLIIAVVVLALIDRGVIGSRLGIRLAVLAIVGWKLGVSYALYLLQNRTFHIYEYYEGAVRSGARLLAVGVFILRPLIIDLSDSTLWKIIVSGGLL